MRSSSSLTPIFARDPHPSLLSWVHRLRQVTKTSVARILSVKEVNLNSDYNVPSRKSISLLIYLNTLLSRKLISLLSHYNPSRRDKLKLGNLSSHQLLEVPRSCLLFSIMQLHLNRELTCLPINQRQACTMPRPREPWGFGTRHSLNPNYKTPIFLRDRF